MSNAMATQLQGKVAFITGAGRGIGAGIASVLASRGALVAVCDVDGIIDFYSKPPSLRHHACHYCKYAIQNELIDDVLTDTIHNDFA